jgi:L,D-peptidoglycan transpeptidase YkuD (ErfK/YbiS/YcfS/YnhG family)
MGTVQRQPAIIGSMATSELLITGTTVHWDGQAYPCAIGSGGLSAAKHEGDGTTPLGRFPLRQILYRVDRIELPPTRLPSRAIRPNYSWCEVPTHTHYNQLIEIADNDIEHAAERLWRDDNLYDIVIPIPGKGSAIFIHLARPGYSPTAGCVALAQEDLMQLLPQLSSETVCHISADPAGA